MAEEDVSKNSTQDLCDIYDFDTTVVDIKLSEFRVTYRGVRGLIDVADLQPERGLSDGVNIASDATEIAGESLNTILMKQATKW